jgi:hypothetical protein
VAIVNGGQRARHLNPELLGSQLGVKQKQLAASPWIRTIVLMEVRVVNAFKTATIAIPSTAPPTPNPLAVSAATSPRDEEAKYRAGDVRRQVGRILQARDQR